jgi:hypothetical protein
MAPQWPRIRFFCCPLPAIVNIVRWSNRYVLAVMYGTPIKLNQSMILISPSSYGVPQRARASLGSYADSPSCSNPTARTPIGTMGIRCVVFSMMCSGKGRGESRAKRDRGISAWTPSSDGNRKNECPMTPSRRRIANDLSEVNPFGSCSE